MAVGSLILDPAAVAIADRKELDLEKEGLTIRKDPGPDWGDAAIKAFMAERSYGAAMIDYTLPPRKIVIPLVVNGSAGTVGAGKFDSLRNTLQAKCSRVNEEGGWLRRKLPSGKIIYADLIEATLHLSAGWFTERRDLDLEAQLEFMALPDFYGEQINLASFEATAAASQVAQIKGNLPGRVDFTITEKSGADQVGLAYHFRCQHYSSAATAAWDYQAEALTKLDAATSVALAGASGTAIRHNSLSTSWTPVLGTNLAAGTYLTHKGLYDVWARVLTGSSVPPWLRLLYDVGDMIAPVENPQVRIPGAGNFYLVNLGQINLREARFGTHRWQGVIQARGTAGGENVYIDRLWFLCADESSGILTAPQSLDIGLKPFSARDEFNQTAGNLTGKTLAAGGTWSALGDPTDGTVLAGSLQHFATRTAVSDEGLGRLFFASTPVLGATVVQCDFYWNTGSGGEPELGPACRIIDINNFCTACIQGHYAGGGVVPAIFFRTFVAGVENSRGPYFLENIRDAQWVTVRLVVLNNGLWQIYAAPGPKATNLQLLGTNVDTALLNTGPLATGKVGFLDSHHSASAIERFFDNFSAYVPDVDAVVFANQQARLSWQRNERQDPTGAAYGPIARPGADLPRIPVSGPEERPVEIAIKNSRGDFGELPDSALDVIKGQLSYRPCWSQVPEL